MSLIDGEGTGTITAAGNRDATGRGYGSYAPYDIGRFLVAGGGATHLEPRRPSTPAAGTPVGTPPAR